MTEEERQLSDLVRLRHALRAMSKSVRRALETGTYEGAGSMMVKNYQRLHAKAVELFPDDFFIDTMQLELTEETEDYNRLAQVQLVTEQLSNYVDSLIRELNPSSTAEMEDLRSLGLNLRDQIVRMTKNTLRNALINIDIGEVPPIPPIPPIPPVPPHMRRKIRINIEDHDDEFGQDFGKDVDDDQGTKQV